MAPEPDGHLGRGLDGRRLILEALFGLATGLVLFGADGDRKGLAAFLGVLALLRIAVAIAGIE